MEANLSTESPTGTTGLTFRDFFVQDGRSTYSRMQDSSERCPACLSFESDTRIYLAEAKVQASKGCGPCTIVNCAYQLYLLNGSWGHASFADSNIARSRLQFQWDYYNIFTTSQIPLFYRKSMKVPGAEDRTPIISAWIQSCMLEHPECKQANDKLPTRVLDLACPEGIKLCSGMEVVGRYVALSHCWGKSPFPTPLTTTKATLLDRKTKINEDKLTKTFQDAIVLARKLSIRYMWADSLCIVQNDEEEWNRESANMASIYENAYLVIAATEAAHGGIGCSTHRSDVNENCRLCFTHLTSQKEEIAICVEKLINHDYFHPTKMYFPRPDQRVPLLSRAWCLQERLLATRVVHLTQSELFWECKSKTLCECGRFSSSVPVDTAFLGIKQDWATCRYPFNLWHRTLIMYMNRDITKQSDRLPAVSGFAKRLQTAGAGDYIAGSWRDNIFADMMWKSYKGKRVDIWQAPSWSWACLKSNVQFSFADISPAGYKSELDTKNLLDNGSISGLYRSLRRLFDGLYFRTTLVNFENNLLGFDPTGEVKSACLIISVATVDVRFSWHDSFGDFTITRDSEWVSFSHDDERDFEIQQLSISSIELLCAWIGSIWTRGEMRPQLLVLRKSRGIGGRPPTPNAFERVGCISNAFDGGPSESEIWTLKNWFSKAQVRTIKIV